MARRSTLLPYIWVCKLYWFPHRGKEGKKKVLFSRKSCLSWLSTKEKCQQEDVRRKDLQSQRKTTPSFTRKGIESPWHAPEQTLNLPRIGVWNILCYCVHMNSANVSVTVSAVVWGIQSYSETVFSCVSSSCRQLLRMTGSGWASVLKTQSSSGRRSSSEKSRYRYLGRQEVMHLIQLWCRFSGFASTADCI